MSDVIVIQARGEARVDSRVLAAQLGNRHKNTMELIERYADKFKRFGHLPFQTEVGSRAQGGGKAERFAILNEDQAYFLLSLSRNTEQVVDLKANLVMAFREARERTAVTDIQYLPLYRELHEEVRALALRAEQCGSKTPERIFHINVNKAINSVMGLASGERGTLTIEQRLLLTNLQFVFRRALHDSLAAGDTHRDAARKGKEAAIQFVQCAGLFLSGRNAA
ncbi:MAG: Rha family transcriptional regulator [Pseudomonas sp.]|nr:Rha family transcriptional regulator [Pseudomonas sp.]